MNTILYRIGNFMTKYKRKNLSLVSSLDFSHSLKTKSINKLWSGRANPK